MSYPTTWRQDSRRRPSSGGSDGGHWSTTPLGGGLLELGGALSTATLAAIAIREGPALAGAVRAAVVPALGTASGAIGGRLWPVAAGVLLGTGIALLALEAIKAWVPGAGWRHCCTNLATMTHFPYIKSGLDFDTAGASCTNPASICVGAQADATPFAAGSASSQRRRYYWQYEVTPGVLRYDIVTTFVRTAPAVEAPRVPEVATLAPADVVPSFAIPAAAAGDTRPVVGNPVPIPWPLVPHAVGLPLSHQTRSASYAADPRDREGLPVAGPVIGVVSRPRNDGVTKVPTKPIARAPTKDPEKKVMMPRQIVAAFQTMAAMSEANDFINSLWNALPPAVRRAYPNTASGRLEALFENFDQVDISAALLWLGLNEIQDQGYGRGIGRTRRAAEHSGNGDLWRIGQSGL